MTAYECILLIIGTVILAALSFAAVWVLLNFAIDVIVALRERFREFFGDEEDEW